MANIFTRLFGKKETEVEKVEERSLFGTLGLEYNTFSTYSNTQAMKLSTAYACTNILSNSVAILPFKVMKYVDGKKTEVTNHPLERILNLVPNDKLSKFNFWKLLIESVILNGNGYIYIQRDEKLNIKSLQLIDPAYVQPLLQKDGGVKYLVAGMSSAIDSVNMIHLFQHCDEMMNGISVIKYASQALDAAWNKEKHSDNFFKSGAGLMGVLKASAPLTDQQKTQIAQSWAKSIAKTAGGGVAILPQGLDFQAISVSPEDQQLLEARQYDVITLCRFFNVSPLKVFDYSHASYNSIEQVSLSFLEDSIMPYTHLILDELNKKLFKPSELGKYFIEFDYSMILQGDKKSEAEYYRTLLTNGILSIDEIRSRLGYSPIGEDYSKAKWMQISYAPAKSIANGDYIKGKDQNTNVNNDVTGKSE